MPPEWKAWTDMMLEWTAFAVYVAAIAVLFDSWKVRIPLFFLSVFPVKALVLIVCTYILWQNSRMKAEFDRDMHDARKPKLRPLDPRRVLRLVIR